MFESEAKRAILLSNKRILKQRPFWNTVYMYAGLLQLNVHLSASVLGLGIIVLAAQPHFAYGKKRLQGKGMA